MAQKAIGPTFAAELSAADMLGYHFSWQADGAIEFFDDTPDNVKAAVLAVYAAHDPTKVDANVTLASKIAAGLAVTSTGTPAISAPYALDQTTLDQIGAVARDAASGLGLPGGASTFSYPDMGGTPRTFNETTIRALYRAMRDYIFALNESAASGSNWPAPVATIA